MRRYSELIRLPTFKERYEYLRIGGLIGESTFGFERFLNQALYTSQRWRNLRNQIIIRDNGCDLAMEGYDILPSYSNSKSKRNFNPIIIHHMNHLTREQMRDPTEEIFDPEFLICVSLQTHNAIHYGDASLLPRQPIERRPNDTCPWK